jgi:hypothetical protein
MMAKRSSMAKRIFKLSAAVLLVCGTLNIPRADAVVGIPSIDRNYGWGWGWYGSGETQHGIYGDSAWSDTGMPSSADTAANDPNNGINDGRDDAEAQAAIAMDAARRNVQVTFESTPQWVFAAGEYDDSRMAYEQARNRVVAALSAQPAYQAALINRRDAEENIAALRRREADITELTRAAAEAMNARAAVAKIESDGFAKDVATTTAKEKLDIAAHAMMKLRQQERVAIQSDPDWLAAQQRYNAARSTLAGARLTQAEQLR